MDTTLSKKLEKLIDSNIDKTALPYVKGNSIRIKNIVVRKGRAGWLVYDTDTNTQLNKYFCRSSALAYANLVIKKRKDIDGIRKLDNTIEKHYNDCIFYLHTMRCTDNEAKKDIIETRYDISHATVRKAIKDLERFIFY